MNDHLNYWQRRVGRRRFIQGSSAAAVGASAFALVGCGDDDDDGGDATQPAGGATTGATTAGGTSPTAAPATQKQKGGVARYTSANNTWDSFDADRTRFGPMGTVLSLTNQGVVGWDNYAEAKIGGQFAESWETPDKNTYVFKIRQNLFWQNKPPLNGRAASAKDIVWHVNRNKAGKTLEGTDDPNFYRKSLFESIEKAEAVDERTVRITTVKPWPFLLNLFAGTWTKVQPEEAVRQFEKEYNKFSADLIIGTGSFSLTEFSSEGSLKFRRFDKSPQVSLFDGTDFVPLFTDQAAQQAAFEQKQVDTFAPNQKSVLDDIKKRFEGKIYEKSYFAANPVSGTWYGGAAPWNNLDLMGAIFRTCDRRGLVQQLLQGRGAMAGHAPPAWAPYALPEKELITLPGYLEDRNKDHTEARKMWDAAGGPALGEITVDIPDIYEGAYSGVSSIITTHLKSVLGNEFKAKLEPYATITSKIVSQKYGNGTPNIWFGWINPPADPDMSLDYIGRWKSSSSNYKQYEVKMPKMDGIIDKMENEFDTKVRVTLSQDAEREVLSHWGAGLMPQYLQIVNQLYHNYYHVGEVTNFVTVQNWWRDHWFDQKDASWQGRPA